MTDRFEDFVTTDKDFDFVDEEERETNRDRAKRAAEVLRRYMAHFPEDVEARVEIDWMVYVAIDAAIKETNP